MKKAREGFTLVELLIVIVIIGILSSMMMISGSEATDAARVTKIVEGFRSVSAAMMMYYADNMDACDRGVDAATISQDIGKFLKDDGVSVTGATTAELGKYQITVLDADNSWWLTYKHTEATSAGASRIGERLQNRAKELGFKKAPKKGNTAEDYDGKGTVSMKVRS